MPNWNYNYYIYLLTNKYNTVIYTGMTNDLLRRVAQHKSKRTPGFTSRYNVTKLVYYEHFGLVENAIAREKQIKAGSRKKKEQLIEPVNPEWRDLFDKIRS
jgi:putative endonuclease